MKKRLLPRQRRSTAGFTLLELLVVIVMIGVLYAIAAPGWVTFMNRQRLSTATDEVFQAIRTAQVEAKRTGTYREVRFDNNAGEPKVAVLPLVQVPGGTGEKYTAITGEPPNWQTLGQGEVQRGTLNLAVGTAGTGSITFDSRGAVALPTQVLANPVIEDTAPFRVTVSLQRSPNVKRCVMIRTLLGATTQGSNAECS